MSNISVTDIKHMSFNMKVNIQCILYIYITVNKPALPYKMIAHIMRFIQCTMKGGVGCNGGELAPGGGICYPNFLQLV